MFPAAPVQVTELAVCFTVLGVKVQGEGELVLSIFKVAPLGI
jgi:hypothetical protein